MDPAMNVADILATYQRVARCMTQVADECTTDRPRERYDVDDLIIREPMQETQRALDDAVIQWQELDRAHSAGRKRKLHQSGASYVHIPEGFDPSNPPTAPSSENDYAYQLGQLVRQVPRLSTLQEDLDSSNTSMMKLKRLIDSSADSHSKLRHLAKEANYIGVSGQTIPQQATHLPTDTSDVILRLCVCSSKNPTEKAQEIELLGSQPLSEIGRHISCLRRHFTQEGDEDDEWWFIEGQFFVGSEKSRADAQNVQGWCSNSSDSLKSILGLDLEHPCPIHLMQNTSFLQLSVRLGVRYLYVHRGSCQHFIYVTDIRSMHPTMAGVQFPRVVFQNKIRKRKCDICLLWTARYTVIDDKLCEKTPCFQCEHCYHMLHYSSEGELIYKDFVVYPYIHDMT